jgi:hypothetical protein
VNQLVEDRIGVGGPDEVEQLVGLILCVKKLLTVLEQILENVDGCDGDIFLLVSFFLLLEFQEFINAFRAEGNVLDEAESPFDLLHEVTARDLELLFSDLVSELSYFP